MFGHAHGCQDRVDRKDQIEQQDLDDRRSERQRLLARVEDIVVRVWIDIMVDFGSRLPDQEEAAGDQYDVAPRSEEHTSELTSLMRISYAVFCLKKKTTKH